jgi:flagellar assembly protein FliH
MTATRVIPKEESTSFQRWEIGSFSGQNQRRSGIAVQLPTASELEAIQQQAHDEGYQAGAERARVEAERLQQLAQRYSQAISTIEESVAEDLLGLALDIAKHLLREALTVKPELILPVVREALASLSEPRQNPVLLLNPADLQLVRLRIGDLLAIEG